MGKEQWFGSDVTNTRLARTAIMLGFTEGNTTFTGEPEGQSNEAAKPEVTPEKRVDRLRSLTGYVLNRLPTI